MPAVICFPIPILYSSGCRGNGLLLFFCVLLCFYMLNNISSLLTNPQAFLMMFSDDFHLPTRFPLTHTHTHTPSLPCSFHVALSTSSFLSSSASLSVISPNTKTSLIWGVPLLLSLPGIISNECVTPSLHSYLYPM